MTYNVEWETEQPELTEDNRKAIARDLAHLTEELEKPGDLIFHHIWLTDDMDGPVIMVYGKDESPDTFYMSYYPTSEWTILDQDDVLED